jgi:hypothetical protein
MAVGRRRDTCSNSSSAHLLPEVMREGQEGNTFFSPSLAKRQKVLNWPAVRRIKLTEKPDHVRIVAVAQMCVNPSTLNSSTMPDASNCSSTA